MLEYPTSKRHCNIRPKRPRRIRKPYHCHRIREVLQHKRIPHILLGRVELLALDVYRNPAEESHAQARCCDDNVRVERLAACQLDSGFGDAVNNARLDLGFRGAQRVEEVPVWTGAEPLLPGVIARREVRIHPDVWGELLLDSLLEKSSGSVWEARAELVEELRDGQIP